MGASAPGSTGEAKPGGEAAVSAGPLDTEGHAEFPLGEFWSITESRAGRSHRTRFTERLPLRQRKSGLSTSSNSGLGHRGGISATRSPASPLDPFIGRDIHSNNCRGSPRSSGRTVWPTTPRPPISPWNVEAPRGQPAGDRASPTPVRNTRTASRPAVQPIRQRGLSRLSRREKAPAVGSASPGGRSPGRRIAHFKEAGSTGADVKQRCTPGTLVKVALQSKAAN